MGRRRMIMRMIIRIRMGRETEENANLGVPDHPCNTRTHSSAKCQSGGERKDKKQDEEENKEW